MNTRRFEYDRFYMAHWRKKGAAVVVNAYHVRQAWILAEAYGEQNGLGRPTSISPTKIVEKGER